MGIRREWTGNACCRGGQQLWFVFRVAKQDLQQFVFCQPIPGRNQVSKGRLDQRPVRRRLAQTLQQRRSNPGPMSQAPSAVVGGPASRLLEEDLQVQRLAAERGPFNDAAIDGRLLLVARLRPAWSSQRVHRSFASSGLKLFDADGVRRSKEATLFQGGPGTARASSRESDRHETTSRACGGNGVDRIHQRRCASSAGSS